LGVGTEEEHAAAEGTQDKFEATRGRGGSNILSTEGKGGGEKKFYLYTSCKMEP